VPVVGSYAEFRLANLNNLLNTRFGPGLRCSGTDNTNYAFIAAASQTSWTQLGILYRVSGAASSGYAGFVVHGHSWAIDDGIRLVLTGQTPVITASVLILPAGGGTPIVVVAPTLLPTAVQQAAGLNSGFPGIVNEGGASPNVKDWAAGDLITGPQPPVPPTSPQGAFTVRTT
jgi:hypothetical protein